VTLLILHGFTGVFAMRTHMRVLGVRAENGQVRAMPCCHSKQDQNLHLGQRACKAGEEEEYEVACNQELNWNVQYNAGPRCSVVRHPIVQKCRWHSEECLSVCFYLCKYVYMCVMFISMFLYM